VEPNKKSAFEKISISISEADITHSNTTGSGDLGENPE